MVRGVGECQRELRPLANQLAGGRSNANCALLGAAAFTRVGAWLPHRLLDPLNISRPFLQVNNAALDCLAKAVQLGGETLLIRVESQLLSLEERNNNSKREEAPNAEEEATAAHGIPLRSLVLRRRLPGLDTRARLVRPPAGGSAITTMSAIGHANFEASSSIGWLSFFLFLSSLLTF